uniref:Uncharacterized protein n=1 Tax=Panagrolaimus davidi TaxID=227884 RepID=A0A914P6A3_9BILA
MPIFGSFFDLTINFKLLPRIIPGFLGYGAVYAAVGAIVDANLPTSITIGAATPTVDYLSNAKLIKIDEKDVLEGKQIQGRD